MNTSMSTNSPVGDRDGDRDTKWSYNKHERIQRLYKSHIDAVKMSGVFIEMVIENALESNLKRINGQHD